MLLLSMQEKVIINKHEVYHNFMDGDFETMGLDVAGDKMLLCPVEESL